MRIKLTSAPKSYKHLEKLCFEVINEKPAECNKCYNRKVCNELKSCDRKVTKIRVVKILGSFSIPYSRDCRTSRQIKEGHETINVGHNPTVYDKKDDCLIGMVLTLDLNLFTVLPGDK